MQPGFPVDPRSERREDHASGRSQFHGPSNRSRQLACRPEESPRCPRDGQSHLAVSLRHRHRGDTSVTLAAWDRAPRIPNCSTTWPRYFVENGWSMKKLNRLIMLSNTYRQSSDYQAKAAEEDPDNKLLWRYNRHRLEAEAIRDSMLMVGGLLESENGWSGRVSSRSLRRCQRSFPPRLPPAAGSSEKDPHPTTIAAASTSLCGATCAIPCFRSSIRRTLSKSGTRARTRSPLPSRWIS